MYFKLRVYIALKSDLDLFLAQMKELNTFALTLNILFVVWEFTQFCITPLLYARSFENWTDVTMLCFTFAILFNDEPAAVRYLSATVILLAWTECLILLSSRHPKYVVLYSTIY